jgi:hypothetical protein
MYFSTGKNKYNYGHTIIDIHHACRLIKKYYKSVNFELNHNKMRSLKLLCMMQVLQLTSVHEIRCKIPLELSEKLFQISHKKTIHPQQPLASELGSIRRAIYRSTYRFVSETYRKREHKKCVNIQLLERWNYRVFTPLPSKSDHVSLVDDDLDKRLSRILTGYVRASHLLNFDLCHCPYVD